MEARYLIGERVVEDKGGKIPTLGHFNVIVAGGGIAGVAAAIAAARSGAKTLLIEQNNFAGGTATAGMMAVFWVPFDFTHGLLKEIADRLVVSGAGTKGRLISFDPEGLKEIFFDLLEESHVDLLLYTSAIDAIVNDDKVKGIIIHNKSGLQAVLGDVVIDCTGDGDIMAKAGCQYVKGREKDRKMRPMTLLFRMGNVDIPRTLEYFQGNPNDFTPDPNRVFIDLDNNNIRLAGFFALVKEAREKGELDDEIHYLRLEGWVIPQKTVVINTCRVYGVDGTDGESKTLAEIQARKQVRKLTAFVRNHVPGFENSFLLQTATNIGVRETRRLRGEYVISREDILTSRKFDDRIAINFTAMANNPIHSPDGGEGAEDDPVGRSEVTKLHYFYLPYRSFLPKEPGQILVAGRCLSATHEADAWCRNMGVCVMMGQAAGTAGALSSLGRIEPRKLNIQILQEALRKQGVSLDADDWQVPEF